MTKRSLIADLFAAVERAEERVKEITGERAEVPTEECLEYSDRVRQLQNEGPSDMDSIAQTRTNIDRYWRNHFGRVRSARISLGTAGSEPE
jgi:hypothetical protein